MSGDNWSECPYCKVARLDALVIKTQELAAAYGSVTLAEFDAQRAAFAAEQANAAPLTFREDSSSSIDDSITPPVVRHRYEGVCTVCGATTSLDITTEVRLP